MTNENTSILKEMFVKHYQELCLLSFSYLGDLDDAKDVVQNIFIKLLQKEQHEPFRNLKSYICTAVRNESLKKIRSNKKTYSVNYYAAENPSFENELIQEEISERILKEIETLPDKNRSVFKLCVLEGIKYENAAEILGITVNTVKYHLKKSFKILRVNLKDIYLLIL
ncbi:MAG TPA: sigma-70 family RNA polymerase sigma factor [Leeuwenhoekiella sp.]|nr:sigma-70 family RNA polymerase sigma factor [Leeuwenhoekiella sp.]